MNEFNAEELLDWFDAAITHMTPAQQRKLTREIGQTLRQRNQHRIRAQVGPEGQAWQQRGDAGDGKGQMFKKLRQNKRFKLRQSTGQVRVGWFGRMGQIARTHHYGLRERLQYGLASYPARELLGITPADIDAVREIMMKHLTEAR